jgi:hypothetical protein
VRLVVGVLVILVLAAIVVQLLRLLGWASGHSLFAFIASPERVGARRKPDDIRESRTFLTQPSRASSFIYFHAPPV